MSGAGVLPAARARATERDAFIEDVEWMGRWGETPEKVADRLGIKPSAVQRRLQRAKRTDVWHALQANVPVLNEDTWRAGPIQCKDAYASAGMS